MSLAPAIDARAFLVAPTSSGKGMTVDKVRSEAGVIVSTIDQALEAITGFSILAEWIVKPLSGDWDAFERGAKAWENAGKAVGGVAQNMIALPSQIGTQWVGEAATAFAGGSVKIAGALTIFQPLSFGMKQWCTALAEMAGYIGKMVLSAIKELSYKVAGMLAAAATVVGALSVPGWVAAIAKSVMTWMKRIKEGIEMFKKFVEMVKGVVEAVKSAIQAIQAMLNTAQAALQAVGLGDSILGKGVGLAQKGAQGAGNIADGYGKKVDGVRSAADEAIELNRRIQEPIEKLAR